MRITDKRNWAIILLLLVCLSIQFGCTRSKPEGAESIDVNLQHLDPSLGIVHFVAVKKTEGIPPSVKSQLSGGIAEPGDRFIETDTSDRSLPKRRLMIGGLSNDYCVLTYEIGGIGKYYVALLLKLSGENASPIWASTSIHPVENLNELKSVLETERRSNDLKGMLW